MLNSAEIVVNADELIQLNKGEIAIGDYKIKFASPLNIAGAKSEYLIKTISAPATKTITISSVNQFNDLIYFPYIPALGSMVKMFNLHVPVAWVSALAFIMALAYSILFLKKRDKLYEKKAHNSAYLGFIFCIFATISGMIWAKQSWGAYWNWDPRETSIFILLTIYMTYFVLRSAIENKEQKSRLSAVYLILSGVSMPFFVFILPRIADGLHPGAANDSSAPLISTGKSMLDSALLYSFSYSLFAFTLLFFLLFNIKNSKIEK
jgi:heme exporter protein C